MKFSPPPICARCGKEMDTCLTEAIVAPPAPTMYLTTWSCSCKDKPAIAPAAETT